MRRFPCLPSTRHAYRTSLRLHRGHRARGSGSGRWRPKDAIAPDMPLSFHLPVVFASPLLRSPNTPVPLSLDLDGLLGGRAHRGGQGCSPCAEEYRSITIPPRLASATKLFFGARQGDTAVCGYEPDWLLADESETCDFIQCCSGRVAEGGSGARENTFDAGAIEEVCDIGCGAGRWAVLYAGLFPRLRRIVLVEPQEHLLAEAIRRVRAASQALSIEAHCMPAGEYIRSCLASGDTLLAKDPGTFLSLIGVCLYLSDNDLLLLLRQHPGRWAYLKEDASVQACSVPLPSDFLTGIDINDAAAVGRLGREVIARMPSTIVPQSVAKLSRWFNADDYYNRHIFCPNRREPGEDATLALPVALCFPSDGSVVRTLAHFGALLRRHRPVHSSIMWGVPPDSYSPQASWLLDCSL